ncbi:MAG: FHA domain-containing protein [Duncaniella sp.]|nr:FHA domain-containing protein [Duncaniella sp.]
MAQKILKITCPDCGMTLSVRPPASAGVGRLRCPACGKVMIINFPPEACAAAPVKAPVTTPLPSPEQEPAVPHYLHRADGLPIDGRPGAALPEGTVTLGRADIYQPSDIQIDDDGMMSRRSVAITTTAVPGGFTHTLEVLNATNPVTINDNTCVPGRPVALNRGDRLMLGSTLLILN